jgi:ATP/maltotriose-dependent transcriptional regulator MalT
MTELSRPNTRNRRQSPLIGRDEDLSQLVKAVGGGPEGRYRVTVVKGVAGIGKTSLLMETARRARAAGLTVAFAGAKKADRAIPLSTLRSVIHACSPLRSRLDRPSQPNRDRAGYLDRVMDVVERYTVHRPLVMIVDDLHEADEASAAALRELAVSSLPVRLVVAGRVPPSSHDSDPMAWFEAHCNQTITLTYLDEKNALELCTNVLGARPGTGLAAHVARAGGSPLLIIQLVRALRSSGRLSFTNGVANLVDGVGTGELSDEIAAAIEPQLDDATRQVVSAASIFGRRFTVSALARLLGLDTVTVQGAVGRAVAAGILERRDRSLEFHHDLVREAVYRNLKEPDQQCLHARAAQLARSQRRPLGEVAHHVLRSGDHADPEAVATLRAWARHIAASAPRSAAEYMAGALRRVPIQSPEWTPLFGEAVELLISAGLLKVAHELGQLAQGQNLQHDIEATLLLGRAWEAKYVGDNAAAVEFARRARSVGSASDVIRARAFSVEAHALAHIGEIDAAKHAAAEAVRVGAEAGDMAASVSGNTALSIVARRGGHYEEALTHALSAFRTAQRSGGEAVHRHPAIWLGRALSTLDGFADAEARLIQARQEIERLGTISSMPLWHFAEAVRLYGLGRLDDALAVAEAGWLAADQTGALQMGVPLRGLQAIIALLRGEEPVARDYVRKQQKLRDAGITGVPELVAWPAALLEAQRSPGSAIAMLVECYDGAYGDYALIGHDPSSAVMLTRIAKAAGDEQRAEDAVAMAHRLARANPTVVSLRGVALHAEGVARGGDHGLLATAVECLRDGPRPLLLAAGLEDLCEAEYRAGHREAAIEHLEASLQINVSCGARAALKRLRKRRGVIGISAAAAQREGADLSPLERLSPTKQEVAVLVAQEMTYGEISGKLQMSRHTVDTHIRQIFEKWEVHSRAELKAIVEAETGKGGQSDS